MRVWSYVISIDSGSAPNFDPPAVTLVVCKPRIRQKAVTGDLVLAFNGMRLAANPNSLRWAGIVGRVIPMERYWRDSSFRAKRPGHSPTPDNFYRLSGADWTQMPNTTHNENDIKRDLSGKNALIFKRAWYFGHTVPELPNVFDLRVTARRTEPLRNIGEGEWLELRAWLDAHDIGLPQVSHTSGPVSRCSVKLANKCGGQAPRATFRC